MAPVLTQSVVPKETWLAERGITSVKWPISGIPDTVHLDNAEEFHARMLSYADPGIRDHIGLSPVGADSPRRHIERLMGTSPYRKLGLDK